ncbi:hypothetical protein AVEN_108361-1 [Araneus ventricosus]|uniref:Endonuclease/exonuclease/phosphatase domain-containing protein n=1 Tax=Araneus ventricosus TaxID=182803 RepID=A0A4Y2CXB2_ARAVE|nr:hypothetical protein AVEN_108361-1 [Araneus ventricosus]
MDFILANNLFINNSTDAPPSFTRNTSKGWSDHSFCTQQMIVKIAKWKFLKESSLSDHQYTKITIVSSVKNCTFTRYKTLHGHHNKFHKNLKLYVNSIMGAIRNSQNPKGHERSSNPSPKYHYIDACNKSHHTKNQDLSPTPNWYAKDLEVEKTRLKALKRRAQRALQEQRIARFQYHKQEQKKYTRKVKTAKNSNWKSLCTKATTIWQSLQRCIQKKQSNRPNY